MVDSASRNDASLLDVLAARARGASDGRLVLDVIGGLVVGIVFVLWRPTAWLIPFGISLCFLCFGVWGIADRELGERAGKAGESLNAALRVARRVAGFVGGAAAIFTVLVALGAALGTWIS